MSQIIKITEQQRLKEISIGAILDATMECITGDDLTKITIDDIATRGGVGRATVYRHFRNKDDIFSQLIFRELEEFKAQLLVVMERTNNPEDFLINAIVFIVEHFPSTPLHDLIFNDKAALYSGRLAVSSDIIQGLVKELFAPFYKDIKKSGQLRDGITESILTDWLIRVVITFITMPSDHQRTTKALENYIRLLLNPSIFKQK